jgi:hypothetical protein
MTGPITQELNLFESTMIEVEDVPSDRREHFLLLAMALASLPMENLAPHLFTMVFTMACHGYVLGGRDSIFYKIGYVR